MADLDPWMLAAFDQTSVLFDTVRDQVSRWEQWREGSDALKEYAQAHGLTDEELASRLSRGETQGLGSDAIGAYQQLEAFHSVMGLTIACERFWAWSAGELFRLRLGPALGYLRMQAECVGLM